MAQPAGRPGGTDQPSAAQVHETHIGVVLMWGERAYKLKKPVDVGFADFSTRERRRQACHREVALNRRIAPDVYLGVADVTDTEGQPCDHLVVMRRMPEQRRLTTLLARGEPLHDEVRAVAHLLADFHASAQRGPEIDREGGRDALAARWRDNLELVARYRDEVVDEGVHREIRERAERFLGGREDLFAARAAEGRIVDGHGDLLTDDIFCLPDGPRVLDCLDFDDRLRWLDGLDDAAFLAMDLERHGRPDLAGHFLGCYADFSGDPAPASLRHHYIAYRAFVRAKVACVRHGQGDQAAAPAARRDADLALTHLRDGAVRLILVGGLPGTGKSTLAGLLGDRLGTTVLSSDRLRKELAGLDPATPADAGYREGLYSPEHTERTYTALLERAGVLLRRGESVVLDASWTRQAPREQAARLAHEAHADLTQLRCTAPPEAAAERIRSRARGASDATSAVATAMAADSEPWPSAGTVDTSDDPEHSLAQALALLEISAAPGDARP